MTGADLAGCRLSSRSFPANRRPTSRRASSWRSCGKRHTGGRASGRTRSRCPRTTAAIPIWSDMAASADLRTRRCAECCKGLPPRCAAERRAPTHVPEGAALRGNEARTVLPRTQCSSRRCRLAHPPRLRTSKPSNQCARGYRRSRCRSGVRRRHASRRRGAGRANAAPRARWAEHSCPWSLPMSQLRQSMAGRRTFAAPSTAPRRSCSCRRFRRRRTFAEPARHWNRLGPAAPACASRAQQRDRLRAPADRRLTRSSASSAARPLRNGRALDRRPAAGSPCSQRCSRSSAAHEWRPAHAASVPASRQAPPSGCLLRVSLVRQ